MLIGDEQPAQRRSCRPVPRPLRPDSRPDLQRPRTDRHPVPHGRASSGSTTASPTSRCTRSTWSPPRTRFWASSTCIRTTSNPAWPDPGTPPPIHTTDRRHRLLLLRDRRPAVVRSAAHLGVPEPLIDVVEPVVKVVVEQGYDRSIPPGEPTPARLIPPLNPVKVAGDLVNAVGEGVNNAAALVGLPKPPAVTHDDLAAPQRKVGGEPATTRDRLNAAIGTVKSVIGDGRTIVRSARSENGSPAATASPARKTPVRDAVKNASGDITKVVTKVSDSVKQALSGGNDDDNWRQCLRAERGKSAESVKTSLAQRHLLGLARHHSRWPPSRRGLSRAARLGIRRRRSSHPARRTTPSSDQRWPAPARQSPPHVECRSMSAAISLRLSARRIVRTTALTSAM